MKNSLLPTLGIIVLGALIAAKVTAPPYQAAMTQKQQLQAENNALNMTISARPAEEDRHAKLRQAYADMQLTLPDTEKLPEILETLNLTARRLGLSEPRQIDRTARASPLPGVTALDFNLSVSGTYARVQAFVQTLARLPRAYTLNSVTITSASDGTVTSTLGLTTYRRDAAPTPAAPAPATSATPDAMPTSRPDTPPTPASPSGGPA